MCIYVYKYFNELVIKLNTANYPDVFCECLNYFWKYSMMTRAFPEGSYYPRCCVPKFYPGLSMVRPLWKVTENWIPVSLRYCQDLLCEWLGDLYILCILWLHVGMTVSDIMCAEHIWWGRPRSAAFTLLCSGGPCLFMRYEIAQTMAKKSGTKNNRIWRHVLWNVFSFHQ